MVPLDMAKRRAPKKSRSKSRSKPGDVSPWLIGGVALAAGVGAFFLVRPRSASAAAPRPALPGSAPASVPSGSGGSAGESNPATRDLQRRLIAWGANITADGAYGPRTDDAVQYYGGQIGLSPSNIAELHTRHTESDVARIMGHMVYTLPTIDITGSP